MTSEEYIIINKKTGREIVHVSRTTKKKLCYDPLSCNVGGSHRYTLKSTEYLQLPRRNNNHILIITTAFRFFITTTYLWKQQLSGLFFLYNNHILITDTSLFFSYITTTSSKATTPLISFYTFSLFFSHCFTPKQPDLTTVRSCSLKRSCSTSGRGSGRARCTRPRTGEDPPECARAPWRKGAPWSPCPSSSTWCCRSAGWRRFWLKG